MRKQFLVYVAVGVLCALIDIGTMQGLRHVGTHYVLAATVGFLLGLVVNYLAHAKFTFKTERSNTSALRYGVLVIANYLLTLALVFTAEQWLGSALTGKLLSLPVIAVNGFLWSRYWVFQRVEPQ